MTMQTTNNFITVCPHCGRRNDAITYEAEAPSVPPKGSTSFCIECGLFAKYDGEKLVKATAEEAAEIAADDDCKRVRAWWLLKYLQPKGDQCHPMN